MRLHTTFLYVVGSAAIGVALFVAVGYVGSEVSFDPNTADARPNAAPIFDVRAVTLDARNRPDSSLLVRLRNLGVTHLTLVSFGWQETVRSPEIRVDTTKGWYSESHTGIRTLARQARALGMDVILKPHIWVGGYDDLNRSEIGFDSNARWREWEAEYRRFLMIYARLAEQVDADVLVLGTELTRSATQRPDFWRSLAKDVRTVYSGKLTFAANWHKAYEEIQFWKSLDYVGVQAYFPLTETDSPSLSTLREGWRRHQAELARMYDRTGRPLLFTEIGYRSVTGAAAKPWTWPEQDGASAAPDSVLQARCYRAFLSTVGRASWLKGAIVWKWHPASDDHRPTAFTPQGKPAEDVLRRWFTGTSADSGRTDSLSSAGGAR